MSNKTSIFNPGGDAYLPPESKDIELQVLADIISEPSTLPTAFNTLSRDDFSVEEYRKIWDLLHDRFTKKETIDLCVISGLVSKETAIKLISPKFGITSGFLTILAHCEELRKISTRRSVFLGCLDMMQKASNPSTDIGELLSAPGRLNEAISAKTKPATSTQNLIDVLNHCADSIQENIVNSQNGQRTRIPTGFVMLDKLTYSGFKAGNLVILSARPSVGKTAIMLQMAKASAFAGFHPTIFSLEMTNEELGDRLLISTGIVNPKELMMNSIDWNDIETATARLEKLPMHFNDTARTIDDICNAITVNHQNGMCDIAFIDYLGLITPTDTKQLPAYAIAGITSRLKHLAKECKIPIVLLSQLNRNSDSENRPPELRDLRDSGSIEQDADIVLMLERKALEEKIVTMWVRKNRQGMAGNIYVELRANDSFTVFTDNNNDETKKRVTSSQSF